MKLTGRRRAWALVLALPALGATRRDAPAKPEPTSAFDQAVAAAEASLRTGDRAAAESRYDAVRLEGWLLLGTLDRLDGRLPDARDAFRSAREAGPDDPRATLALAVAHLQLGEPADAVTLLQPLADRAPGDAMVRRLHGQALLAAGQAAAAVAELEAAHAQAPGDAELAFALAGAHLAQKEVEPAARLFDAVAKARPLARTHLLIGRTYLAYGEYARARAALQAALARDPALPYAHYHLGLAAVMENERTGLAAAIDEFQAELRRAPGDPLASTELGITLVESQRGAEALAPLARAARAGPPQSRTLYYLGRAQLGAERPQEAAASLQKALDLAQGQGANPPALRAIHLQLAQALRRAGRADDAATHFAEAERMSAEGTDTERANLARYLSDALPADAKAPALPVVEASPLAALGARERAALRRQVSAGLARAYLNLGIKSLQDEQFAAAAERLQKAAVLDPDSAQVQSSLGIALFNAKEFAQAVPPLTRAHQAAPADRGLSRLLAMAFINTEKWAPAVELLKDDPERTDNASLQFAYGLALVRSERGAEAEQAFADLVRRHGDSAELSVLLGQAHAQQGDYEGAIASLTRALAQKPDVAEANGTLGVIYLRQGRLPEAEAALRAEVEAHPGDLRSQQHLAIVLESQQKPDEAVALLRSMLASRPDLSDARYLLGKILLAQGAADEAARHLETAAQAAPEDANIHYQLGRAYQKLGRTEQAEQQFEVFRQLKEKSKGAS